MTRNLRLLSGLEPEILNYVALKSNQNSVNILPESTMNVKSAKE